MKNKTVKLIYMVLIWSILLSIFVFAEGDSYTVRLYKDKMLVSEYTVSQGASQKLENGTVLDGQYLKGWVTADNTALYGNLITPTENIDLYALYGSCEVPTPGVNMFENPTMDEDIFGAHPANGKLSFVEEEGNRILRYERNSGYTAIQRYVPWEAGRKYELSFKIKTDDTQKVWYNTRYRREGDENLDRGTYAGENIADTWSVYHATVEIADDHIPSDGDAITFFSDPGTKVINNDNFYDDLCLIPYYKISYNLNGGENGAPSAEYTLDNEYSIHPDAIPQRSGYLFKGWGLTQDATENITTLTLDQRDVVLYAIWEFDESSMVQNVLSYEPSTEKKGIADGTIRIKKNDVLLDYEKVELFFGDEMGTFSEYTTLATLDLKEENTAYTMEGNRALPDGATRIYATFSGNGLESKTAYCDIPETVRLIITEKPILRFYSISDIHVGNDYWPEIPINRNRAVEDIQRMSPDFLVINGDLVDHGIQAEYDVLKNFLQTNFNEKGIPAFIVNGNHELFDINYQHSNYDLEALLNAYDTQLSQLSENSDINISREEGLLYYCATFKDRKLIFVSAPEVSGTTATYTLSDAQLKWLDEQLYDAEKSNMTAFVFIHVGLKNYIAGRETTGVDNTDAVVEILNRHPNTLVFSAHTHSFLDDDQKHTKVGDMIHTFSFLNDGCAVWLNSPNGGTDYFKEYSMGQYIEVYSDKILVKARQFTSPGKFISKGLYLIEIPDSTQNVGTAEIEGALESGSTLTAKLDGGNAPAGSTYEWRIGNIIVGKESTYVFQQQTDYIGKKLTLRITLPDGTYTSCVHPDTIGGITISYDLNGGQGEIPPSVEWLAGTDYTPYTDQYFPMKEGMYFIGWSTDNTAVKPQASVEIKGDTKLYAVYSEKPEFEFEANLSGFEPGYGVAGVTIKDGKMICTSGESVQDLFFTFNNANIDADRYQYLRIKVKFDEGSSADCMYFETEEKPFDYAATRIPFYPEYIVDQANGMDIYEFYIPQIDSAKDYWRGTVKNLRYDVIECLNGRASTDYIMFSDKKGIFNADITVTEPETGNLIKNDAVLSNPIEGCTIKEAGYETEDEVFRGGTAYTFCVTLAPNDGYTFTTAEDLLDNIKVNGKAVSDAVINTDGTVKLTYRFDKLPGGAQDVEDGRWSVWDGTVDTAWGENYDTTTLLEIHSASEFIAFRNMVLEGKNFQGKQVSLQCDIDLNHYNLKHGVGDKRTDGWTEGVDLTMFGGTFNGNGHIIKNLSMNPNLPDAAIDSIENSYFLGLFFISSTGQILDLGLEEVNITLHDQAPPEACYAGLLSINSYGTVTDCYVKNLSFYGGWTEDNDSVIPYFSGIAARCVGGSIKNSYVDGIDYTGITKGLFHKNARKSGIATTSSGAAIQNCYSANIQCNLNDTTDESTVDPNSKVMNNYDATVYEDDTSALLSNLYAQEPCSILSGVQFSESNAAGTLEEAMENLDVSLGDAFVNLSELRVFPKLKWEKLPQMFSYTSCKIYKDYGKLTETEVTGGPLTNGVYTLEITGVKNETGIDAAPVISMVYLSDGVMEKHSEVICPLYGFAAFENAVTVKLDLTDTEIGSRDFIQAIIYQSTDQPIPLISAISVK